MTIPHHSLLHPLPFAYAKRHNVVLSEDGNSLFHGPHPATKILLEVRRYAQRPLQFQEVSAEQFENLLAHTYAIHSDTAMQMVEDIGEDLDLSQLVHDLPKTEEILESDDDAPIIRLLNALFSQAIKQQASDIHIEPFEEHLLVRFRIDGILREVLRPPRILASLLISRVKVMARLDIAEKRLPQDGRISLRVAGRPVDVRVSTLPSGHGERVVMRLLDKKAAQLDLRHLGMAPEILAIMEKTIRKPHGIILVTGPTGSGKTTTLYAVLTVLNDSKRNILTVEDPIEYYLPGIGQTQVNYKVDMTFARGLRAILRQDPDVVMVGEIRDLETAQIAVQASLTGHLVLSTLHTNSAIGAITRLQDMGVEPFLLASSLIGIAAQRLVRILCNHCKQAAQATPGECKILGVDPHHPPIIYHTKGCTECHQLGYRGRTGIYEIIAVDDKLRVMIHEKTSEQQMENYARTLSSSIRQDGSRQVLLGNTTIEELLRVTYED